MPSTHPLADDLDGILQRTESSLRSLRGERIFLTGGTGFFGRWLLEALTWANDRLALSIRITTLSRNPDSFSTKAARLFLHESLSWLRGDVRDFEFPAGTFSFIIHAATPASEVINRTRPAEMFNTVVEGTRRVLDFATHAGCRSMLLTSSGAVQGPQPPSLKHMDEDFPGGPNPCSPLSAYAEGKRVAEFLSITSEVPVKIARGYAFVGPFLPLDAHFAAGNFIRDAVLGRPIQIQGDGSPLRSYLYAADLVVWLLKILIDGSTARPYNVGSDEALSIAELAHAVSDAAGGIPVQIHGSPDGSPAQRYVPSIERARHELKLDAWTPLSTSLLRTIAWAKKQAGICS